MKLNLSREQLDELADGLIATAPRFRDTALGSGARRSCYCDRESSAPPDYWTGSPAPSFMAGFASFYDYSKSSAP